MDLVPHQLYCEPRQQGTVLCLLLTICSCYYTSSSTLHSTARDTGRVGNTLGWPEGLAIPLGQSLGKPCKSKTVTPDASCPTKVLRPHHPQFSPSTALAVQRGGLDVPKCTNESSGLPAEFFISRISFWEFFKMIL